MDCVLASTILHSQIWHRDIRNDKTNNLCNVLVQIIGGNDSSEEIC